MFRLAVVALALTVPLAGAWGQAASDPQPVRITITKTDCSRLVRHQPADDVTYRPGGDSVNGKPVAPADLPGSPGADLAAKLVPDVLEIPLNIKPLKGKAYATHGLDDTTSNLGVVRYDLMKGTFTLNGEPLGDPDLAELSRACAKRGVR